MGRLKYIHKPRFLYTLKWGYFKRRTQNMNARKYGRSTIPGLISAPFQPELRLRGKKKAAVKSKLQGCAKCGAAHVTLRKVKEGYGRDTTEFLLCPRCYERRKHR